MLFARGAFLHVKNSKSVGMTFEPIESVQKPIQSFMDTGVAP